MIETPYIHQAVLELSPDMSLEQVAEQLGIPAAEWERRTRNMKDELSERELQDLAAGLEVGLADLLACALRIRLKADRKMSRVREALAAPFAPGSSENHLFDLLFKLQADIGRDHDQISCCMRMLQAVCRERELLSCEDFESARSPQEEHRLTGSRKAP